MGDFILPNDTLEFQNQRQSIKISYLQQELKQLQEHVQDLENIIKLNKEALRIAVNGGTQQQPNRMRSVAAGNESTNRSEDITTVIDNKGLHMLIDQLQLENIRLLHIIDKVTKQRNQAQSQALINAQICEETERRENETIAELREKIFEMKKALQDKEFAIQELEKVKPLYQEDGTVIKYREVLNPHEGAVRLQNEVENLTKMLSKVTQELNKTQEEKEELRGMNMALTAELQKLASRLSNPSHAFKPTKIMADPDNLDISDFPSFQGHGDSEPEDPDHVLFPDKVKKKPTTSAAKAMIPKLDLTKAKQIQDFNAKKSTLEQQQQQAAAPVDPKLKEKVTQLSEEVENTKKLLAQEVVNNRLLSDQINELRKQNRELASLNETLINANRRYEEKWQKFYYTLEFYKEFYYKHFEVVTTNLPTKSLSASNTNKFKLLDQLRSKLSVDTKDLMPDQMIMKRIDEENENQGAQMNLESCKIYLMRLAQDIEHRLHFNRTHAKKWKQTNKLPENEANELGLRRTMSNVLDGFEEKKKKDMFEQGGLFRLNVQKKKYIEPVTANKQALNLDLSVIDPNGNKEAPSPMTRVNLFPGNQTTAGKKRGPHDPDGPSFTYSPDKYNNNVSFISNGGDIFD